MAYNGYNGYSPYFQSQSTEQNGRTQYQYQTSSGDNTGNHQRYNYAAPNTASNNSQQHGQAPTQNQTNYAQNPYTPASYQNPHRNYSNSSNTRATGDSALGSLAYASTLRQNPGDPIQRVADFNNQNVVYDQSQGHGQNQGVQRSESRGAINTRLPNSLNPNVATQSQPGYPAYSQQNQHNAYGNQYGGSAETRRSSQQGAPPSRPASGQGMQVVNQHRQSTHSPRPNKFPNAQPFSTHRTADTNGESPVSRPSSTQTRVQRGSDSDSHPRPATQTKRENAALSGHKQAESGTLGTSAVQKPSNTQFTQLPSIANVTNTRNNDSNNVTQNPTTVDPNQIFNHYEYQKRQAAIAAEAEAAKRESEAAKRKAAEEAEEARKKTEAAKQIQQLSQANGVKGSSEEARKEEMEAEMRLMLEKMRDYKSKDPTLFSQIWEQVKKAQPPGSSKDAAQPSAELPASKEVALPSPVTHVAATDNHGDPPHSDALQTSPQADGAGLPDRGKFPAARRGRPGRRSRGGRALSLPGHGQSAPVSQEMMNQDAPNAPDPNSQLAGSVDAPVSTSSSKEPAQKVWVSGKQAQAQASQKKDPKAGMSSQPKPPSGPVEQQAPPRPSGQTLWPEKDKWTLAIAARDTLLLNPVNVGKTITSEEVHRILNEGPSYEELCRILEAKGFVVDRTPFAQRLLSAVPRLQDSQSRPPGSVSSLASHRPPAINPHLQPPGPVSSFTSHPPPAINPHLQQPHVQPSVSGNVAPTAPMFGVLQPISGPYTPGSSPQVNGHSNMASNSHWNDQQNTRNSQPSQMYSSFQLNGYSPSTSQQPEISAPQSVSKQQAARKREFSEIVDLTTENAEDEELARQRDEQLRKIKQMQQVKAAMDAAMATKSTELPSVGQKPKGIHLSPGVGLSSSAPSEDEAAGASRRQNATPRKERKSIVKSIQRVDALRRSSYDARTIARDILIATGKHLTMSALNYHLDPLRERFRHVDYRADLSTFDWASVDPGGPPVKPRYVEDSMPANRPDDVDDADDEDADSEVVASKPRKARQAATNATSDTVMLDLSLSGPIKGFFASPSAIRGRGRPRGHGPRPTRGGVSSRPSLGAAAGSPSQRASPPTQTFATPASTVSMENRGDVSMLGAGISAPIMSGSASRPAPSTPLHGESSGTAQPSLGTSETKRRGRPPKNKTPTATEPTASTPQSSSGPLPTPSTQWASLSHVPASVIPGPRVVGSSSHQFTTTPGRPSGLRNQIPVTSPFAVVIPQRSPSVVELSESSQPRKAKKVKRSPPPKYQVYKCRSKDCKGELHNLETLRKHVRNHIDELDGDLKCFWSGCGTTKIAGTSTDDSALQPLCFKSETAWERHMDGRHLDHYAWELGDGPSTHPSGKP